MFTTIINITQLVILLVGLAAPLSAAAVLRTNNDPNNQIRFTTPVGAETKRQQLIDYIWADGFPGLAQPVVSTVTDPDIFLGPLNGITPSLVSVVLKIDANVSGSGFLSTSYLLRPANSIQANRFVIVHQGHEAYPLSYGVGAAINNLLEQGFSVDVMQMPLFGWNTGNTANISGYGQETWGYHDSIIIGSGSRPHTDGIGYRFFLEPVIQNINYIEQLTPAPVDISMIGLSGGAWTTSMAAAIDPRINLSIPVAGSAPLFIRNTHPQPGTYGDLEQHYEPLFAEDIDPDGNGGGIATWLEIYTLGGYGTNRRQIMVTIEFDHCCFSGATFADPFKTIVATTVSQLGKGKWEYFIDRVTLGHQLSTHTFLNVIDPALHDRDGDGILDTSDNCTLVPNSDQRDTDSDNYGNLCDGDFNNDGDINTLDLYILLGAYRSVSGAANYNIDIDLNGDGAINTTDLNIFKGMHRKSPGPSGLLSQ